jgi:hypothetical protein
LHIVDSHGPDIDRAAHEIAQAAIEAGERVVENDKEGRCVTTDLYALSLNESKRHLVNPVRALTAADDLIRGVRDYIRGPKRVDYPNVTPWIPGSVVE